MARFAAGRSGRLAIGAAPGRHAGARIARADVARLGRSAGATCQRRLRRFAAGGRRLPAGRARRRRLGRCLGRAAARGHAGPRGSGQPDRGAGIAYRARARRHPCLGGALVRAAARRRRPRARPAVHHAGPGPAGGRPAQPARQRGRGCAAQCPDPGDGRALPAGRAVDQRRDLGLEPGRRPRDLEPGGADAVRPHAGCDQRRLVARPHPSRRPVAHRQHHPCGDRQPGQQLVGRVPLPARRRQLCRHPRPRHRAARWRGPGAAHDRRDARPERAKSDPGGAAGKRAPVPHPVRVDRRGLLRDRVPGWPPRAAERLRARAGQPGLCSERRHRERRRAEGQGHGAARSRCLGRDLPRRAGEREAAALRARTPAHRALPGTGGAAHRAARAAPGGGAVPGHHQAPPRRAGAARHERYARAPGAGRSRAPCAHGRGAAPVAEDGGGRPAHRRHRA